MIEFYSKSVSVFTDSLINFYDFCKVSPEDAESLRQKPLTKRDWHRALIILPFVIVIKLAEDTTALLSILVMVDILS